MASPARSRFRTRWASLSAFPGQPSLSSLARRASVSEASLSALEFAGVMIKASLDHNSRKCWQCYRLPRWETLARRASEENADRIPGADSFGSVS